MLLQEYLSSFIQNRKGFKIKEILKKKMKMIVIVNQQKNFFFHKCIY